MLFGEWGALYGLLAKKNVCKVAQQNGKCIIYADSLLWLKCDSLKYRFFYDSVYAFQLKRVWASHVAQLAGTVGICCVYVLGTKVIVTFFFG